MAKFRSVEELVKQLRPVDPVYCFRKDSIKSATNWFKTNFPGKVLFAVKCNPNEKILKTIISCGIENFDTASLEEIKLIKKLSINSKIYFMHTIKNSKSISEAYFKYNVKDFAFDSKDELDKILKSTNNARDLNLYLRLQTSNEHAEIDLSKKFGATVSEATPLLKLAQSYSKKLAISFHVGSQCMNPISYSKAINDISLLVKKTGITPDIINVGGGFPTTYPDLYPQPLKNYIKEIDKGIKKLNLNKKVELICEPGRALVAESGSTIVKVELRKKQNLYINDGTYGSLFDAGQPKFIFPSKAIQLDKNFTKRIIPYSFFGPTCDGLDYMKGPFNLPSNIKQGDYIEIGQLGAYGISMRTKFNGFYSSDIYEVEDSPIMSIYDADENNNIKTLFA
ncbi:MAG: ornithine decarboxylase [Candidatus Pelagibacter sp.]|nr:ornithine decarboxylase [Candidatus Pelagibacter sp.]MAW01891.1 ornithine decarboxylase [Candidatus Pelagibacter sp.]OUV96919.1 MAG: ornithine decarboxylase [Candidatus Pelagibacter sp. TMED142]OUV97625.1 MAG: ornithine decarboxylase [Candidatus Pelagibacter sp. TMED142]|tara:strand:- start:522 stop:1706 length:1185 start_codon:yes stop_codon:yes gene_type:complete